MNIEYVAQYGTSGYANAAKGNMIYLESQGHNICFSPLVFDDSQIDKEWEVDKKVCSRINNNIKIDIQVIHTIPNLWNLIREKTKKEYYFKKIGYCTWETTKLPRKWVDYINMMDEVWVPSTFNMNTFIESGVNINVNVFPHLFFDQLIPSKIDINLKDCFNRTIPNDKFTFYCIGEYVERKGIKELISVFKKLCHKYKDIQLILKLHHKDYSEKNVNFVKNYFNEDDNIYPILKNINNKDLLNVHGLGDCYVSLHKGEGFGLPLYDAFNYNKKIVATKFGGPMDYLNDTHQLVDFKLDIVNLNDEFYDSEQKWGISKPR